MKHKQKNEKPREGSRDFITFLLDIQNTKSETQTANPKSDKKKSKGIKVDGEQEVQGALRMRWGDVSIIHWQTQ